MQYIITIAASIIGSSAIATVVVACLNRKWQKEDRKLVTKADLEAINAKLDALTENQKVISVERIRARVKECIVDGHVDLDDKENIKEMHDSYHKLGGNGHLDAVMDELEKLPVK